MNLKFIDAALLKFEYSMDLNKFVAIISIQCLSSLGPSTNIVVDNINRPDYEEVIMEVVDTRECTSFYPLGGNELNSNLCAHEIKGDNAFEIEDKGIALVRDGKQLAITCGAPTRSQNTATTPIRYSAIETVALWIAIKIGVQCSMYLIHIRMLQSDNSDFRSFNGSGQTFDVEILRQLVIMEQLINAFMK